MSDTRTRVLLTGATGNWGRAALREFRERADRIRVTAFSLATAQDRAVLDGFADMENLTVLWGDLTDPAAVADAVRDVDLVLHVGAVVSPLADAKPELARAVNIQSMRNIVSAVRALPDPAQVGVVGIGTVAETGSRNPPHHWGRIGDPIRVSEFDEYGQTKVVAERILIDSGLPRWASLRQTGIFHPGMLEIRDPIMTHSVLGGVMEWVTAEDSARLLAGICDAHLPDEFWGGIYNIGGGGEWRLTNWQLQQAISGALGVGDVRKWYERNWFATRNFHGQWYSDSDRLHELVPFREDTFSGALHRAVASVPASVRSAGRVPAWIVKRFVMKPLARQPRGTLHALAGGDERRIAAHYGSRDAWATIGDWDTFEEPAPSRIPTSLEHGYDESLSPDEWDTALLAGAAEFRGGRLVDEVVAGTAAIPTHWECADGHRFAASPKLVLTGGHWCPDCVTRPAEYRRQAERNPFLAQLAEA